jgi:hypothetical protein
VNLAGLLVGIAIAPLISGNLMLVWFLFVFFTFLHLFANYQAVSVVSMETFNRSRLHLLMKFILSTGNIPTPSLINAQEPILRGLSIRYTVQYGACLMDVLHNSEDYNRAVSEYDKGRLYLIKVSQTTKQVQVAFHSKASVNDQLKAAFVVELFEYLNAADSYSNCVFLVPYQLELQNATRNNSILLELCQKIMDDIFPTLMTQIQTAGWVTSHHLLGLNEWRYTCN